jgi:hypothetical protein
MVETVMKFEEYFGIKPGYNDQLEREMEIVARMAWNAAIEEAAATAARLGDYTVEHVIKTKLTREG